MAASPDPKCSVLLVEDDGAIRGLLSLLLALEGYDVETAEHGLAALDAMKYRLPDVILLDLLMPTMDGRQFLAVLRSDPRTQYIPVVITSAQYEWSPAPTLGVTARLTKPFQVEALCAAVDDACRHQASGAAHSPH
jgi:CheY-like chemotaxis protein